MTSARLREILGLLPASILLFVVSRFLFDLLAGREPFWMTREDTVQLLWSGCFIVPFMLFGLMVARQRQMSGTRQ
jgi:hypothetical protein